MPAKPNPILKVNVVGLGKERCLGAYHHKTGLIPI
jgi:hypothetical protein